MRRDQRVGHVADRDEHRDRHAALAGRAVGRADRRVGGELDVGVGQHHHVVLRAAERLHALAVARAGLVDVLRDRRRADEAHRGDAGVLEDRVDRDLVAVHDVEDARRQARLGQQLRRRTCAADGSFSDGFRMNVLPHAIAIGYIHIGTIAGKLNGVMPATTPSGWRIE